MKPETTPAIPPALAQFDNLPDSAHVRLPVVCALRSISAPTVWRWVKDGLLPAPVKLGPNTTAWVVGDLRHFIPKTPCSSTSARRAPAARPPRARRPRGDRGRAADHLAP